MSRLIAYLGNDASRLACALQTVRPALVAPVDGATPPIDSWGIGFYQGEVLLQRRPKAPTEPVDFYEVAKGLRTDVFVGHVRAGTVGKPKHDNTHPFRFRSWLFAHHGTLPQFDAKRAAVQALVPDFLARNIRGETDSETLFFVLLAELHRLNRIEDPLLTPAVLREAVRASLLRVEDALGTKLEGSVAITNGRMLTVSRQGAPVHLAKIGPVLDCALCRDNLPAGGRRERRTDHEHLRAVLAIAGANETPSGGGAAWQILEDRHVMSVAHDMTLDISVI